MVLVLLARMARDESFINRLVEERQRARNSSQQLSDGATNQLLPTVFRWQGGGKEVFVTGSFNNWKTKIPMAKSQTDFFTIVDLPEGEHQYKFLVDGQWLTHLTDPVANSEIGTKNSIMTVKRSDFDAFEALAIDSEAAKIKKGDTTARYGQIIPPRNEATDGNPPSLPPQLLEVILNKDTPAHVEPSHLPEPNHVMLNHLYALSIRDSVMVLSATHRFRKKFVTTLLYKPI
uniref:5'-AMP-activated protein kinase subunit beta-1 n=1 Tax=Arion vulgaris TaxID=1028688 RepID=A0A0B7BBF5_9EUPU